MGGGVSSPNSALLQAVRQDAIQQAIKALRRRADPNWRDPKDSLGWTSLLWASANGNLEMAKLLIEYGANKNGADRNQCTALYWAVKNRHYKLSSYLLAIGVNVDSRDADGYGALHKAASAGNFAMVALLLAHGANVQLHTLDGFRPIDLAYSHGHQDVFSLITEAMMGRRPVIRRTDRTRKPAPTNPATSPREPAQPSPMHASTEPISDERGTPRRGQAVRWQDEESKQDSGQVDSREDSTGSSLPPISGGTAKPPRQSVSDVLPIRSTADSAHSLPNPTLRVKCHPGTSPHGTSSFPQLPPGTVSPGSKCSAHLPPTSGGHRFVPRQPPPDQPSSRSETGPHGAHRYHSKSPRWDVRSQRSNASPRSPRALVGVGSPRGRSPLVRLGVGGGSREAAGTEFSPRRLAWSESRG